MSAINVEIISQLEDNYAFVLYDNTREACIIDPAESMPIIEYLNNKNLKVKDIFITHHHKDHTSGIEGLIKNFPQVNIHSPNPQIENSRFILQNNDEVESRINSFKIISTPGHTLDHIVYYDDDNKILFSGDTLFRLGCGRVFEGTLNQMYSSLQKIKELKNNTTMYCGHEYTINNLNFLENTLNKKVLYNDVRQKIESDIKVHDKSIPFHLDEEKSYNLFLNQESQIGELVKHELKLGNFELFKYLRERKDNF
tara:strand:- start:323 stop:1084 length:762 start_codon:yes stop_codon:yes gene_type:complete